MDGVPSPRELVRAFRTVDRLVGATFHGWGPSFPEIPHDRDGRDVWSLIVEAKHAIAVATSVLGAEDEAYAAAWEKMI